MDSKQLKDVIKTTAKTQLVFENDDTLDVGAADIGIEDDLISIFPKIREIEYRVLYTSVTLNKQGTSTPQELKQFWEDNGFFFDNLTLQDVTEDGNTTTEDIIQLGGKMVAPEFEVSGASVDLSQRVKLFAFGSSLSVVDNVILEKNIRLKIPFTIDGTAKVMKPILGERINIILQPIDTAVFSESSLTTGGFTGTADFVTEIITIKFQDAGKKIKLRTIGDNGTNTFDLFGTSEDPYLRFTTVAGVNIITLKSPIPSNNGVVFTSSMETEDGSPINILGDPTGDPYTSPLGDQSVSIFCPYLELDTHPYSEVVYEEILFETVDEKTAIVSDDIVFINDSEDSSKKKKVKVGNLLQAAPIQEDDTLSGTENDYSLVDVSNTNILRLVTDGANVILTGIEPPSPLFPKTLILVNADSTNRIRLSNQSTLSVDVNRIITPSGLNFDINKNSAVAIIYDTTSNRWRLLATA